VGTRLRPDAEAWHGALRGATAPVWALRRDWVTEPSDAEREGAAAAGVRGLVREDVSAWEEIVS
jgi:hypothetical protein